MIPPRICIKGTGIICALGRDEQETLYALENGLSGLKPLTRFIPSHLPALPVGETPVKEPDESIPLTHQLARIAADEAMSCSDRTPDAIVLGVTTGGMAATEPLIKAGCTDPAKFQYHAIGSVAADLAQRYDCKGPLVTVSTACSSGGGAIAVAMAMLRSGRFHSVLTGGVDSLCRLTYYGFKSLQLIDPRGSRPLDLERAGMSVAEGAGMLLLEATTEDTDKIQILGTGLSCDAHHPAQPHPEGQGALAAMQAALSNAHLNIDEIDYINLHGTGTTDNDRSEARAVNTLFGNAPPPLSSIKGATGHSLAAAGAIETVIASQAIEHGLIPANVGCQTPDPDLALQPVTVPTRKPIATVLSNSFGFGGNNAAVIIGRSSKRVESHAETAAHLFSIADCSCVTGAGHTEETIERLRQGLPCHGVMDSTALCADLPLRMIRRVKRLSQMAMALSVGTCKKTPDLAPDAVFFGTAWGSLSETNDFLQALFETEEKFTSPTDFIGSVHNAPAGQIAMLTQAKGANITVSGGDYSFEQTLFSAQMLTTDHSPVLVLGADEGHPKLSPLFDPSVAAGGTLSDGGGALLLTRAKDPVGPTIELKYFKTDIQAHTGPQDMLTRLGGPTAVNGRYGLILAGIPAAMRQQGQDQLDQFIKISGYTGAVVDYRHLIGEFAAATAVATVLAASLVSDGQGLSLGLSGQSTNPEAKAVLIIGLGSALTAIEVAPS